MASGWAISLTIPAVYFPGAFGYTGLCLSWRLASQACTYAYSFPRQKYREKGVFLPFGRQRGGGGEAQSKHCGRLIEERGIDTEGEATTTEKVSFGGTKVCICVHSHCPILTLEMRGGNAKKFVSEATFPFMFSSVLLYFFIRRFCVVFFFLCAN